MLQAEPFDYSEVTWSAAFAALCAVFRDEYAFSQWKGVDGDALQSRFGPRISDAEAAGDKKAYYLALREFLYAVPDANISLWGDDWDLRKTALGGSYGLDLVRLDDGRTLVSGVPSDGPAARAGIERGAQLLAWNDLPPDQAVTRTNVAWSDYPPPTKIRRALEQCRLLTRAPLGTVARVEFQNRKSSAPAQAELTAAANGPGPGGPSRTWHASGLLRCDLDSTGIGVLTLNALPEAPLADFWENTLYERFREFLLGLARGQARAVVLDLRQCVGMNHRLAARLAGIFHRQPLFYAVAGHRQGNAAHLKADPRTLVRIVPQDLAWRAPVAALVGPGTMGAAEGLARAIQSAAQGLVVGSTHSGGRFGQVTGAPSVEVWLPEGYNISFPREAALNQDGVVKIESNRFGEGGVRPNVRVPASERTFEERWLLGRDVELTFARQALAHRITLKRL
jgi:carboxyl-terminal processing protease